MITDFDDFHASNHRLDLLCLLREANPNFRVTLFAVPGLGNEEFWDLVPDWCELAVHGWLHPDPHECEHWTYEQAMDHLLSAPIRFVDGFKAPGWQISDGTYEALLELGWWCADHPENNRRRPAGLRTHVLGEGDHWHGHIQNVCGNGLEETWDVLLRKVTCATSFELISESVLVWRPQMVAA